MWVEVSTIGDLYSGHGVCGQGRGGGGERVGGTVGGVAGNLLCYVGVEEEEESWVNPRSISRAVITCR